MKKIIRLIVIRLFYKIMHYLDLTHTQTQWLAVRAVGLRHEIGMDGKP